MRTPVLSVVTAVFNGRSFLRETIASVLAQSFRDFEFILVDDASTDDSVDVIREFDDARVVLVRNEANFGIIASRNKAIALAKGNLIALLDQDDLAAPERFAKQVAYLNVHPNILALGTWVNYIAPRTVSTPLAPRRTYTPAQWRVAFLFFNGFTNSSLMLRRLALSSPAYTAEYALCEDYYMLYRLSCFSGVAMLDEALTIYRYHENNASVTKLADMHLHERQIWRQMLSEHQVIATSSEISLHQQLAAKERTTSLQEFREVTSWFNDLAERLLCSDLEISAVRVVLRQLWFDFCQANTQFGWVVWSIYQRSASELKMQMPWMQQRKLQAKCVLSTLRG
jgi:glycosyltransferase involved in cell wall biosynthesis